MFPAADRAEIAAAVSEILGTGSLTLGPYTRQFEAAFAAAHGAPHAAATASGTSALDIALRVTGVEGRDVIVPANTFFATAAAVRAAGGTPVFADIDPATFALSPQTVAAALTPGTAAVVLVHIGGLVSPQADALARLCTEHGHHPDRGRGARAWGHLPGPVRRVIRGGGRVLLLPDQGADQRRGRDAAHLVGADRRPRPGSTAIRARGRSARIIMNGMVMRGG